MTQDATAYLPLRIDERPDYSDEPTDEENRRP